MGKLLQGEIFLLSEEPVEDTESGITRAKGKALKDDKEGWITLKGNAGTPYAQASTKHYTITDETSFQKAFSSDSEIVRPLEVGEAMLLLDDPKEDGNSGCPTEVVQSAKSAIRPHPVGQWTEMLAGHRYSSY